MFSRHVIGYSPWSWPWPWGLPSTCSFRGGIVMGHKEVYNIEKATVCKQILWYCWLGLITCINRPPYNLYCVGGNVKHCSTKQTDRVNGGLQGASAVARNLQVGALSLSVLGRGKSKGQRAELRGLKCRRLGFLGREWSRERCKLPAVSGADPQRKCNLCILALVSDIWLHRFYQFSWKFTDHIISRPRRWKPSSSSAINCVLTWFGLFLSLYKLHYEAKKSDSNKIDSYVGYSSEFRHVDMRQNLATM